MNDRLHQFLAAARAVAMSPVEHAETRAALSVHVQSSGEAFSLLQKSTGDLRLSAEEKAIGRARLFRFMRATPRERRPFFRWFAPSAVASAMAATLLGGGIAWAAEGTVPGDLLYPVKVRVTEPIIAGLSVTPARRAQWDVRRIERRLTEAAALDKESPADDRQSVLRAQMEEDTNILRGHLATLPSAERRAIRTELLTKLTQHRQSLLRIHSSVGIPASLRDIVEQSAEEDSAEPSESPPSSSLSISSHPSVSSSFPVPLRAIRERIREQADDLLRLLQENPAPVERADLDRAIDRALQDVLEKSRSKADELRR